MRVCASHDEIRPGHGLFILEQLARSGPMFPGTPQANDLPMRLKGAVWSGRDAVAAARRAPAEAAR